MEIGRVIIAICVIVMAVLLVRLVNNEKNRLKSKPRIEQRNYEQTTCN